jgi:formate hydrogenlyase subunit 3/multisubunit Na+/H+ antiporter MnhD subunit
LSLLALIALPIIGALVVAIAEVSTRRRWPALPVALALAALALEAVLLWHAPVGTLSTIAGITLTITPLGRAALLAFCGLSALAVLYAWPVPQGDGFPALALLLAAPLAGVLLVRDPLLASLNLGLAGAVGAMALPGGRPGAARPGLFLLACTTMGAVVLTLPFALAGRYTLSPEEQSWVPAAVGLVAVGFGLIMGAAPLWLPGAGERGRPMAAALNAAWSGGAIIVLLDFLDSYRWLATSSLLPALLLAGGLAMLLFGAGMALLQGDPGRLSAYALVASVGPVFLALTMRSTDGQTLALALAAQRGLAGLILLGAAGVLRGDQAGAAEGQGRGWRFPLTTAALAMMALALVLAPLAGTWPPPQASLWQANPRLAPALALASIALLLAYGWFFYRLLRSHSGEEVAAREPRAVGAALLLLALVSLWLALHPVPLLALLRQLLSS